MRVPKTTCDSHMREFFLGEQVEYKPTSKGRKEVCIEKRHRGRNGKSSRKAT